MPTTNYYSINGELIGEKIGANARTDYLTDALGNVTATLNTSGAVVNTYRYKPYGGQLAKTGAGADPAFRWVGNQGYRQTGKKYSDVYIRARHYDERGSRWTIEDPFPLSNIANLFSYVLASPVLLFDPSGLRAQQEPIGPIYDQPCCSADNQKWYWEQLMSSHCKGGWTNCDALDKSKCNPVLEDCHAIRNAIVGVSRDCNTSCTKGSPYSNNSKLWAAVMCCYNAYDKSPKFCGMRCCPSNFTFETLQGGAAGCILACLKTHEDTHISRECTNATPPCGPPWNDWVFPFDECCAYISQVRCLYDKYKAVCGWEVEPPRFSDPGNCLKYEKSKCPKPDMARTVAAFVR